MEDIKFLKNEKKAIQKFMDLKKGRQEIIRDGSKSNLNIHYFANQMAERLHPKNIEVEVVKMEEHQHCKSFYFKEKNNGKLPFYLPGSYITIKVPILGGVYQRAYTLSDVADGNIYRITIQKRGIVSTYFYDEVKEKDTFFITGPQCEFTYNGIRDSKHIICICEGMGITSIYPIIKDLLEHKKVESISLLYKANTIMDVLWKEQLEGFLKKKNFTVKFILTEENDPDNHTTLSEELEKQDVDGKSFFISVHEETYKELNQILKKLDVPNKYVRHEIYKSSPDFLLSIKHNLTVIIQGKSITIPCAENETLVASMEKHNISPIVSCTVGVCGFCRSKLIHGEVKTENSGLRKKDIELKYIHPCVTYPLSDVTIEISK